MKHPLCQIKNTFQIEIFQNIPFSLSLVSIMEAYSQLCSACLMASLSTLLFISFKMTFFWAKPKALVEVYFELTLHAILFEICHNIENIFVTSDLRPLFEIIFKITCNYNVVTFMLISGKVLY